MISNFILPVTPTIIKNFHLPDYLFGISYAGMSLTCFLFAPFWAKISDRIGRVKVYAIGCFGYALAQVYFCFSSTQGSIMAARIISGVFIGGINICHLSYLIDACKKEELGKNIIIMSTLVSVFSAFGYLIGGVLGDVSISLTFIVQAAMLSGCGLMLIFFLRDAKDFSCESTGLKSFVKETNPFSTFVNIRHVLDRTLIILMAAFFLLYTASTACDQCFNYYIKDQFNFPPSYNGYLKALMGFITLAMNFTVCRWILKKPNFYHKFIAILMLCTLSEIVLTVSGNKIIFLTGYFAFFSFNAVNATLQQSAVSKIGAERHDSAGIVALYNSVQSLGSVAGAGAAGLIYSLNCKSSFLLGAILVFMAAVLMGTGAPKQENAGAEIQAVNRTNSK